MKISTCSIATVLYLGACASSHHTTPLSSQPAAPSYRLLGATCTPLSKSEVSYLAFTSPSKLEIESGKLLQRLEIPRSSIPSLESSYPAYRVEVATQNAPSFWIETSGENPVDASRAWKGRGFEHVLELSGKGSYGSTPLSCTFAIGAEVTHTANEREPASVSLEHFHR